MKRDKLLKTGIIGAIIAGVCCFTPLLVILFGAAGLLVWVGYLDYILMPALVLFIGITAYAFFIKKDCKGGEDNECRR